MRHRARQQWLWPSSCWSPSPLSVVLPAVPPSRKPFARISPAGPDQVADPLEAEHRIVDVERDHRLADASRTPSPAAMNEAIEPASVIPSSRIWPSFVS